MRITEGYDYIRRKSHYLDNQLMNKKAFLWTSKKNRPDTINLNNLMLLEENLFLNIPMPLKKYRW